MDEGEAGHARNQLEPSDSSHLLQNKQKASAASLPISWPTQQPQQVTDCVTLVDLLRLRAEQQPTRCAYIFLADGESDAVTITYSTLDQRASAIAARLQEIRASGERVLLLYPPGVDYLAAFFGCLYAGCIAVPAYLPRLKAQGHTLDGLRNVVANAQIHIALTTTESLALSYKMRASAPEFETMMWVATDTITASAALHWSPRTMRGDELAFLQYTSGSTSTPKGVMLSHTNLLYNLASLHHSVKRTPDCHAVSWLPPYHDMGLIGGILYPLYAGFPVTLMTPVAYLQQPIRWLQAISRTRATISAAPNFAYDLCVRKITLEQRASLDLSCWKVAINGAEPIRAATLEHFATTFALCGFSREAFYPTYGLAEATLMVSGGTWSSSPIIHIVEKAALESNTVVFADKEDEATEAFVSCGYAMPGQQIVIVDPNNRIACCPGQIGEVWLTGPSIARGYWDLPDETNQTFHAYLADTGAGPYLRTGDLGYLHRGELVVTGRLKDLIIIRGHNYYPQDIEQCVEQSHTVLRPSCGAAFSVVSNGEERLTVVFEVERSFRHVDVNDVIIAIRRAVSEQYGLYIASIVLLRAGSVPKTTSGKIRRHICKNAFLSGTFVTATVGSTETLSMTQSY